MLSVRRYRSVKCIVGIVDVRLSGLYITGMSIGQDIIIVDLGSCLVYNINRE